MRTRGMQGLTANRISTEFVSIIYLEYDEYGDGSAVVTDDIIQVPASVGILQAKDIERLEKGGIIIRNGITIVIPDAREEQPDTVIYYDKSYRVVEWIAKREDNHNFTVVATCDEIPITGAV